MRTAVAALLISFAAAAYAHSPIEGLSGFYTGLLHPILATAHLIAILSLGLLVGQHGGAHIRWALPSYLTALALGLAAAGLGAAGPAPSLLLMAAALGGALVALRPTLPPALSLVLALLLGLAIGLDSAPESSTARERLAALVGSGVGAGFVMLYVVGLTDYLRQPWQRLGVRILGSWICASAVMVLALSLAPEKPAAPSPGEAAPATQTTPALGKESSSSESARASAAT